MATVTLFVRFTVEDTDDHLYKRTRDEFHVKLKEALARSGGSSSFYREKNDPPAAPRDVTLLIEFSAKTENAAAKEASDFLADPDLREITGQAQAKGLVGGVSTWLTVNYVP